jgi:large subunit ribosomal protein L21
MQAIVRVAGVQARVAPGDTVFLPLLSADVGTVAKFSDVLLLCDGEAITVGTPVIEGAYVEAEILNHARAAKVLVFKKKRRKRYRRLRGHRQAYTQVLIKEIVAA